MKGNLKIHYAKDGKLAVVINKGITQEAAQVLAAEAITKYSNVQITWTGDNGG